MKQTKLGFLTACVILACLGCNGSKDQANLTSTNDSTRPQQEPRLPPRQLPPRTPEPGPPRLSPLEQVTTATYREKAKTWCQNKLFQGQSEEQVYAACKERPMHYIAVGFLEMFPESKHHDEIAAMATQFDVAEFPKAGFISYEDLKSKYGFNGQHHIYRWDNSLVALTTSGNTRIVSAKSPAEAITLSSPVAEIPTPLCFGNLQMLHGTFQTKEDGVEFHPGCAFIYPKKASAAL